jgi:hypothetical protein
MTPAGSPFLLVEPQQRPRVQAVAHDSHCSFLYR